MSLEKRREGEMGKGGKWVELVGERIKSGERMAERVG